MEKEAGPRPRYLEAEFPPRNGKAICDGGPGSAGCLVTAHGDLPSRVVAETLLRSPSAEGRALTDLVLVLLGKLESKKAKRRNEFRTEG